MKTAVSQRADLTFKHNRDRGRHGWLRLTPAYSVKLTEQLLLGHPAQRILDPFSGTGTTALCAAQHGKEAVAVDINPFLVWLTRAKLRDYPRAQLERYEALSEQLLASVKRARAPEVTPPPLHNIQRWWEPSALRFLCRVHAQLRALEPKEPEAVVDLLKVAFCRCLIALSNAAFNHPSMSFKDSAKDGAQPDLFAFNRVLPSMCAQLKADLQHIGSTALTKLSGQAKAVLGDAQKLSVLHKGAPFDMVLTSPPYPNRMSYIRELRPYMYWLGFLERAAQASELDWSAIGGTWGKATSNLASWTPQSEPPARLQALLRKIEKAHPKNGPLMSRYVQKYFQDMAQHLRAITPLVRPGGSLHYIVGNASFYGHLVPVEALFIDLMKACGLTKTRAEIIRKRNSKRELYEFHVQATKLR